MGVFLFKFAVLTGIGVSGINRTLKLCRLWSWLIADLGRSSWSPLSPPSTIPSSTTHNLIPWRDRVRRVRLLAAPVHPEQFMRVMCNAVLWRFSSRRPDTARNRFWAWLTGLILPGIATCLAAPGCAIFSPPAATAPRPLSWLTHFVSQPLDASEAFDLNSIKPPPHAASVGSDSLLEITVWDLLEPGSPHTFPVRVSAAQTIDVPLLGEISVAGKTIPEIEQGLHDALQSGEFLNQPRVLVRSLDAPQVTIHVSGAVIRPGPVALPRTNASVYAALVSAGGLKAAAGTQIAVSHKPTGGTPARHKKNEGEPVLANAQSQLYANAAGVSADDSGEVQGDRAPSPADLPETHWYDVSVESEARELTALLLSDGDGLMVKAVVAPIRISGEVARPGAYALPTDKLLNVWQALLLAGDVQTHGVPLNITLVRPARDGRGAQRWFVNIEEIDARPAVAPAVQPGDLIHVEQTTSGKIRRAVGDLWNK